MTGPFRYGHAARSFSSFRSKTPDTMVLLRLKHMIDRIVRELFSDLMSDRDSSPEVNTAPDTVNIRGHQEAESARWLFHTLVREVTRYMTLDNVRRNAMVVADEFVVQPSPGKVGLRLREDRLFRPFIHGDG